MLKLVKKVKTERSQFEITQLKDKGFGSGKEFGYLLREVSWILIRHFFAHFYFTWCQGMNFKYKEINFVSKKIEMKDTWYKDKNYLSLISFIEVLKSDVLILLLKSSLYTKTSNKPKVTCNWIGIELNP